MNKLSMVLSITYLLFLIFWLSLVLIGTGYVVFVLDRDPLWFAMALLFMSMTPNPKDWKQLICPDSEDSEE